MWIDLDPFRSINLDWVSEILRGWETISCDDKTTRDVFCIWYCMGDQKLAQYFHNQVERDEMFEEIKKKLHNK